MPMPLNTFTTPDALKMLDYFGWPEGIVFYGLPGSKDWYNGSDWGAPLEHELVLSCLQAHLWKIIRDRFDYTDYKESKGFGIELCELEKPLPIVIIDAPDLDTLLENTCTWIMERELVAEENENG